MILQSLFHIILLSWPIKILAQAPAMTRPHCQTHCGVVEIPYPFGIEAGCYIDDWFAIDCNSRKPIIKHNDLELEVLEISVQESTMRVYFPVLKSCEDDEMISKNINLEATPFAVSKSRNRFTGLGCNNIAYMLTNNFSIIGGCFSICEGNKTAKEENSCYGIECCQTLIPSSLRTFNATVGPLNDLRGRKPKYCNYAFLVDQEWFEWELNSPQDVQKMEKVPVVLDWGIFGSSFNGSPNSPHSSCKISDNFTTSFNGTSSSTQFPVVQCHCASSGFGGNPYLPEGCQDINECRKSNPCGEMLCENFKGGYSCYSPESKKWNHTVITAISTVLGSLLLLSGAWWLCILVKNRKDAKLKEKFFKRNGGLLLQQQLTSFDGNVDRSKLFNSEELDKATDHFNVNRILGQGGQGTVYKGMLEDGRIIAVKKSKVVDEGKLDEFINEVVIVSQINHRNVVKLLGCCLETEVPLLVYEFIPNGTLFQYLHDRSEELPLAWEMRLQIAAEVASALSYLHSAASLPIYHRDIKSTNILLDDKYKAKVADFGTSKSIAIDQTHVTTKVQGTFGYLDPEYFQSSQFTDKSDVYSFGVVLVELLTGQKPISSTIGSQGCRSLATNFIYSMKENHLYDILDAQITKLGKNEEIMAVANIAKRCLNLNGKKRPTMKEVAVELEAIQQASQKGHKVQQNYEEVEYVRTEVVEPWDVISTSTSSTFDHYTPPVDSQPLLPS